MIINELKSTIYAVGLALNSKKHLFIGIASAVGMGFLSVYIPSAITPGNTIEFQLSLLTPDSVLLIVLFSVLFGISVSLHSYAMSLKKNYGNLAVAPAAGFAGIIGGLSSAPLCASCIGIILSTIGIGSSTAFFILAHRTETIALSILIITASIYFASKKATKFCDKCQ